MSTTNPSNQSFCCSNVSLFYDMLREAYDEMHRALERNTRPKPGGEPGNIITPDPQRRSMKAALVVIVFAGLYLEALFHILIVRKHGEKQSREVDRKTYEDKLKLLGCTNDNIAKRCAAYRVARREVVHEKAYFDTHALRTAQREADAAYTLVCDIRSTLGIG